MVEYKLRKVQKSLSKVIVTITMLTVMMEEENGQVRLPFVRNPENFTFVVKGKQNQGQVMVVNVEKVRRKGFSSKSKLKIIRIIRKTSLTKRRKKE